MSDKKLQLRIVTPDKIVVDTAVDAVGAIGSEGDFAAYPGHIPFLTDLQPGLLWYREDGVVRDLAVAGGFIDIQPNQANVLADSADYLEDIDVERAELALKTAEEKMDKAKADATKDDQLKEITEITASMTRAATRLKLVTRRIPR